MKLLEQHAALLKGLSGKTVEAGWFASARYQAGKDIDPKMVGMPVARVARINEFGATIKRGNSTITIPARPFMRGAVLKFKQERIDKQAKIVRQMLAGKINPDQALMQIGLVMEGCIVDSIKNGGWTPNAPSTIAKKGFDKPLINTAQMWQAVTSKVVKST